jgi:hypothetical protein
MFKAVGVAVSAVLGALLGVFIHYPSYFASGIAVAGLGFLVCLALFTVACGIGHKRGDPSHDWDSTAAWVLSCLGAVQVFLNVRPFDTNWAYWLAAGATCAMLLGAGVIWRMYIKPFSELLERV